MLYWPHHTLVPTKDWHWPHFQPSELACSHCLALRVEPNAMDQLERVRLLYDAPIRVASFYRCKKHPIEAAKSAPGPHTRGTAVDPYPANLISLEIARMEDAFFAVGVLGRGKGLRDGVLHLHFDWDTTLGKRSWGY